MLLIDPSRNKNARMMGTYHTRYLVYILLYVCVLHINPFRTAVPFWGHTALKLNGLSPKRDCGSRKSSFYPSTSSTTSVHADSAILLNRGSNPQLIKIQSSTIGS